MSKIHNSEADDYKLPNEPKFYGDSIIPIPPHQYNILPVKPIRDEVCEFCAKEDVCGIKEESMRAYKDILDIEGRTNVFINTSIKCKKFLLKPPINNIR